MSLVNSEKLSYPNGIPTPEALGERRDQETKLVLLQNDPFFNTVFNRLAPTGPAASVAAPMDAYRRGTDVWVHLDLPGIAADSLDISVERNVLTVVGERFWERQESDQVYVNDRTQGTYRRQVHLGEGLDAESIEADYQDGVLTLRIPVAEKAKPRKIAIKAATGSDSEPVIEAETVDSEV